MFSKKKFDPSPRGVPLGYLETRLSKTTLKISRDADSLIAEHQAAVVTKLKVVAPARDELSKDPLQAVVQITTDLPRDLTKAFLNPQSLMTLNQAAVFGALTLDNGRCFIGSRLTVFEQEQAWNLYIPFLLCAVISGREYHVNAILSMLGSREARTGDSAWAAEDFNYVQSKLSEFCVCTANGGGLTAEFGLRSGMGSAALGHHMTALWQLKAEEPHPGAGGGLLCILRMPHRVSREQLPGILADLNRREMAPRDQPPHFGAWCQGNSEDTVAYASFLPNAMHRTEAVALNVSIWAFHRAHWVDAYLASIGVHS